MASDLCYTFQVHSPGMLEPEMEMERGEES